MFYYKKDNSVISTTHVPRRIEGLIEITEAEYKAFIEGLIAAEKARLAAENISEQGEQI